MRPRYVVIGERIKRRRLDSGFTQDTFAEALGTTRQIVIGWEKGRHRPGPRYRARIALVLSDPTLFAADDADEEAG